jgi:hypothetical protein
MMTMMMSMMIVCWFDDDDDNDDDDSHLSQVSIYLSHKLILLFIWLYIHNILTHNVPWIDPNDCELLSLLLILHHANIVANSISTGTNCSSSTSSSSSSLHLVNVTQAVQLKSLEIDYEYILRQCRYYKR